MSPQQVKELIRKYASGNISEEEVRLLMEWYHSGANRDVEWPMTDENEKELLQKRMLSLLQHHIGARPARIISIAWTKVAAILVTIIGLGVLAYFLAKTDEIFYTVTNNHGKILVVELPDNSKVWLNAATTLKYHPDFKEHRELKLEGEAFFEVSKDADHPFTISSGDLKTTVVGTSFNVSAYPDDEFESVSVITGKVKVNDKEKQIALLEPAKSVRYDKRSKEIVLLNADTLSDVSWAHGKLRFDGQSLKEIVKSIERWYGYKFVFNNGQLEACRYYLNIDNTLSIKQVLPLIREVTGVDFIINETKKSITLTGSGCQ